MSDILEKTFKLLPQVVTGGLNPVSKSLSTVHQGSPGRMRTSGSSFADILSKCRTQRETDEFIKKEINLLKTKLGSPGSRTENVNECLVRIILCFLMGYDVSFAHIYCVKLAQQGKSISKKVGYLSSALFFSEEDDMILMLVNTIQKDLQSSNIIEVCAGLVAASQLITSELIPTILPVVESKINHPNLIVRKKAISCLHSFYLRAPFLLSSNEDIFKVTFCDKNPEIMIITLPIYVELIKTKPAPYYKMIPSLVHILEQIIDRKFPTDFEHHNVPAPWLQIQLLHCLGFLGKDNEEGSELIVTVLNLILQRVDPSQKMGLAVIYECVKTIGVISAVPKLIDTASLCVKRFISAKNVNLKYLGIKGLGIIVEINAAYAIPHQDIVIECLSHHDLSIRRNVIDLLFKMVNENNYKVICLKIMTEIHSSSDSYSLEKNVLKITDLTERFSSDILWYVNAINNLIQVAEKHITDFQFNSFVSILKESNLQSNGNLENVLECYVEKLKEEILPDMLLKLSAWVLGEFCDSSVQVNPKNVISTLENKFLNCSLSSSCKGYFFTAFMKLSSKYPKLCKFDLNRFKMLSNDDPNTLQRFIEFDTFFKNLECVRTVKMHQWQCHNVDTTLSFIDEYVSERLEMGSRPYQPRSIRCKSPTKIPETFSSYSGLNMPAETGISPSTSQVSSIVSRKVYSAGSGGSQSGSLLEENNEVTLKLTGVKKIWVIDSKVEDKVSSPNKPNESVEEFTRTFLSNDSI